MEGAAPVRVACRAKINPALHVLGRRGDGYHDLSLEFVMLALADRLELRPARGFTLEVSGPRAADVPVAGNLVLRAAEALQALVGETRLPGCTFRLEKRIPAAAGLGGGSSDAAGALLGLSTLFSLEVSEADLARLALELGSDVPYFLKGGRQWGTSRGEVLEPLPDPPDLPVLLLLPPFGLSTREVFERHAAATAPPGETDPDRPSLLTSRKERPSFALKPWWEDLQQEFQNQLWAAAVALNPRLEQLAGIAARALPGWRVGMSGSGPVLFAIPGDRHAEVSEDARTALAAAGLEPLLTRTVGAGEHRRTLFSG